MVEGVGIEPTLTALSGQCLRVYKARPKANISNPSIIKCTCLSAFNYRMPKHPVCDLVVHEPACGFWYVCQPYVS
jgi:hypothetical protein